MDAVERLDQLGLVEGPGADGDVDARGLEVRGGEGVQVFEEEGA
nr:hypothetical protein [Cellulosimicrobium sp. MM]